MVWAAVKASCSSFSGNLHQRHTRKLERCARAPLQSEAPCCGWIFTHSSCTCLWSKNESPFPAFPCPIRLIGGSPVGTWVRKADMILPSSVIDKEGWGGGTGPARGLLHLARRVPGWPRKGTGPWRKGGRKWAPCGVLGKILSELLI